MSEAQQIRAQLEHLIGQLSGPLPAAEQAAGWTVQSRSTFLDYFRHLHRLLVERHAVPPSEQPRSIARDMDYWGITGGRLLEEAVEISQALARLGSPGSHGEKRS